MRHGLFLVWMLLSPKLVYLPTRVPMSVATPLSMTVARAMALSMPVLAVTLTLFMLMAMPLVMVVLLLLFALLRSRIELGERQLGLVCERSRCTETELNVRLRECLSSRQR